MSVETYRISIKPLFLADFSKIKISVTHGQHHVIEKQKIIQNTKLKQNP